MTLPKTIGRYEILEQLGHGAMGAVYRAHDPAMDRVVAVKTILVIALGGPQVNEYKERFYREARAVGKLAHPGIVPVYDVGEHKGVPFLVMEFINGRTLADAARGPQRFTLDRVCEIGQQIAEALGYAHSNGVVHRDIKPANILLTSREAHGIERPKIADFGVAKVAAAQITTTGQMLGTPAFMPPEQFTGSPIDGRSDLFALGVILYWLATGEQAFPGETMSAVAYKVVHTEPVPPAKLNPAIPPSLERVILKCLAKDPMVRYQSGEELARELAELRAGRGAADLQSTTAIPMVPASAEATLDSDPQGSTLHSPPARTAAVAPASAAKKRDMRAIAVAAVGALVLLGGWYVLRERERTTKKEPEPPPLMASAPAEQPPAAPAAPVEVSKSPSVRPPAQKPREATLPSPPTKRTVKNAAASPAVSAPAAPAAAPAPEPPKTKPPARVEFDPLRLDPNQNAKLRVESEHFPTDLAFKIEMNGKFYLQRQAGVSQQVIEGLYVPPGVHELRIVAESGAVRKTSNIVSAEFKAKKRRTLKVELRFVGKGSDGGRPKGLYEDSQIVATLK